MKRVIKERKKLQKIKKYLQEHEEKEEIYKQRKENIK